MIAAPAGYGKTTLAAEWLRNVRLETAWLSLDETDNDPAGFITYFITALRQCHPSLGEDALRLLLLPQPPRLEVILTGFLNEISGFDRVCILCLDDYHEIHNQVIHKALAFILDHQPENLHLTITTREDPLLPIGRLRARDHLLEIRQQDLQFSTQEIARFMEERLGQSLSPDQIAGLERRAERIPFSERSAHERVYHGPRAAFIDRRGAHSGGDRKPGRGHLIDHFGSVPARQTVV